MANSKDPQKYEELNEMFNTQVSALCKELEILNVRMTELKQASNAHGSTNGQESKIEVKKESENNKTISRNQMMKCSEINCIIIWRKNYMKC